MEAENTIAKAPSSGLGQSFQEPNIPLNWIDFGKRQPWQLTFLACHVDSPVRNSGGAIDQDSGLSFVENITESKDVCQNADLHLSQGFLASPATFLVTQSLIPIFSESKPSIFNDILYPSPWYWIKKVRPEYKANEDPDWSIKKDLLYWTGSSTGGHTTLNNWQYLHRQRLTLKTSKDSNVNLTLLNKDPNSNIWTPYQTKWSNISHLFDIRITSVPEHQCEPEACKTMSDAFDCGVRKDGSTSDIRVDSINATYLSKYVLDMDGNTFSGRFYRLLETRSAVLKQTIFKEWHDGRLIPWVHYIPVSPSGDELGEIMRFLTQEEAGRTIGRNIAAQGRDWAKRTLRIADIELTFLRLLMEYGRLVSDERDYLGYKE